MSHNGIVKQNVSHVVAFAIIIFVSVAIALTYVLTLKNQDIRQRAATTTTSTSAAPLCPQLKRYRADGITEVPDPSILVPGDVILYRGFADSAGTIVFVKCYTPVAGLQVCTNETVATQLVGTSYQANSNSFTIALGSYTLDASFTPAPPASPSPTPTPTPTNTPTPTPTPTATPTPTPPGQVNCDLYTGSWHFAQVASPITLTYIGDKVSFVINGSFPHIQECGRNLGSLVLVQNYNNPGTGQREYYRSNLAEVSSFSETQINLAPAFAYTNGAWMMNVRFCYGPQTNGQCQTGGGPGILFNIANPLACTSYALAKYIGSAGSGLGQFKYVSDVVSDNAGNIYVSSLNEGNVLNPAEHKIDKYNPQTQTWTSIMSGATYPGENGIISPYSMYTVDNELYFLDRAISNIRADNIKVINKDTGAFIRKIDNAVFGQNLTGIAIANDAIYVSGYEGNVTKLDMSGNLQNTFAPPGPTVSMNGMGADSAGNIYISNISGGKIYKLPAGGTALQLYMSSLSDPRNIRFDKAGNLFNTFSYVAGSGVRKYSSSGSLITTFGVGVFPSWGASGLALDNQGYVYTGDFKGSRVAVFYCSNYNQ